MVSLIPANDILSFFSMSDIAHAVSEQLTDLYS